MTYDPQFPDRRSDPRTTPVRSRSLWGTWAAIIAVILVAGVVWFEWGGSPETDPISTSSTTPSTQPAPAPATPTAPTSNNVTPAPASPPAAPAQQ
ncbi:hypothetical protein SAMN02927900_06288 [Rhizobium mongolense subsp. loessense]|uniref:Uncharacterized protein n=1 Tax=Rhizobium mongolense subsp. loessense TaxID=158890 RepID=A0A1G4U709_9HYPH|nr:hypothetical protein [Rhizobium mongolense]SCW89443.1 hypothetical protein SAMN02927900_06288 [Rhizobium mongolense subsp. loessense]